MIINSFYSNFNSSASGSGIKLLLGNELPETVELNAFYAIPKVEVSKSYFSENEPSPQEGIIWIRTCSTDAVETIFTSDSEPQLVYGIVEAQQYYNDAWHTIDFYIGREENWEKISSFAISVSYTGNMVESEITDGENTYRLFTITNSGTLTIGDPTSGDVWLCGGGSAGTSYSYYGNYGGAGAYAASLMQTELSGDYVVSIGAAQSASSVGTLLSVSAVSGRNGGTGGGGYGYTAGGNGDGISKYPFGDTALKCHCAGGGGGGCYRNSNFDPYYGSADQKHGGNGGTNGGNGGSGNTSSFGYGSGGNYGGGGGNVANATFYGGGGRGSSYYNGSASNIESGSPSIVSAGSGYQGVCYIRIKK